MKYLVLMLKGLAVGAANIVPGVSGATLALIFRVYDKLIESINNLFTDMKKSLQFLIPLGLGMIIGILAVGMVLDSFIQRFPFQFGALIAGLMAGSMPFIYRQAVLNGNKKPYFYGITVLSALIIILLTFVVPTPEAYVDTQFSFGFAALLFVGGLFAAAAMIIPGVSGAIVLSLFGLLPLIMHTITHIVEYLLTPLEFHLLVPILQVVVPIGLGMVAGILLASRLIAFLLEKFHSPTYFAILGMVFGSIFAIFNNDSTYANYDGLSAALVISSVLVFFVGMIVSSKLGKQESS